MSFQERWKSLSGVYINILTLLETIWYHVTKNKIPNDYHINRDFIYERFLERAKIFFMLGFDWTTSVDKSYNIENRLSEYIDKKGGDKRFYKWVIKNATCFARLYSPHKYKDERGLHDIDRGELLKKAQVDLWQ